MSSRLKIAKINQLHVMSMKNVNDCNYTISAVTSYYSLVCKSGDKYVDVLNNDRIIDGDINNLDSFNNFYEIENLIELPKSKKLLRKLHI